MIGSILHPLLTLYGPDLHAPGGLVTRYQTHIHAVHAVLSIADALAGEPLGIIVTREQRAWVRVLSPENSPLTDDDVLILYSVPEHQRLRLCSTTLQRLAALGPNRAATVSHLLVSGLAQLRNEPNPQETSHAQ